MTAGRPTTYDDFAERMSLMFDNDASEAYWRSFRPRPTDLIISPHGKSGTTWLQQIVHGLRTGGDMDFDDISRVVPWIETAYELGIDLDAEQRAEPRAFKSHLSWHDVPQGARYIVSVRDPKDVFVSLYRFMEGWMFEPGSISMDEFAARRAFDLDQPNYWAHLGSWLSQRSNDDVLLVAFENMKEDLAGVVRRVAEFAGTGLGSATLEIATRQASFEFMSSHREPFVDHGMRTVSEQVAGIPPGGDSSKVREGTVGAHARELSPAVAKRFDEIWDETIRRDYGYESYANVVADLTAR